MERDINPKYLKPYSPNLFEPINYQNWLDSGYFNPDNSTKDNLIKKDAEVFSIVLPPPNVTGSLHTGHALMLSIQDIIVRYQRMLGKKTLWIPGTDHAAIATQSKVEKILEKEGAKKQDLGREEFLKRVNQFAKESHDTIINQTKKMGASLDWSREAFTLDETRAKAVYLAFKQFYDLGIIYRGDRIVNWDPKGQTVISDDEIVYEERKGKFYTFKYGPFEIGTARPETKFGDKYVVMHPEDERYKDWQHMQKIKVEWINGEIEATIIKDEMIDMEFGTGVMTITPWHSHEDFALAEKYKLEKEQIIDQYSKLLPIAQEFAGIKIAEAREKIVEKLAQKGLLVSVNENYINRVATAERSGAVIEPQIMKQWFIDVNKEIPSRENKSLKELMLEPVKNGEIKILPDRFEKIYFNWINNLRDWCISRQIWYGHRIPVWYRENEIYCDVTEPKGDGWLQDEDTLDTWFSSGLWTFSTLLDQEKYQPDLKQWLQNSDDRIYHPTNLMETGHDIIFFWVARMILMTRGLIGEIPFKQVYFHGMVRTKDGQKMSKSLGNAASDPLEIIEKYGADALRMSLIVSNGPGQDVKLAEEKIKAYGKFANKLWNIARFVLENTQEEDNKIDFKYSQEILENKNTNLDDFIKEYHLEMADYKLYLVSEKIYHYVWHQFADIDIEEIKIILNTDKKNTEAKIYLRTTFVKLLKLLHPFMPFVTEEIWKDFKNEKDNSFLMISRI